MKNDPSLTIFISTLFTLILPIGIHCCGYSTYDIIILMSRDPDYQRNPCYIQWQEEQDAKQKQFWKQRDEFKQSVPWYTEIREENRRREEENRRYMNRITTTTPASVKKKQTSVWTVLGILLGVFVGICFCGACISCLQSDDDSTELPTTTTPQSDPLTSRFTAVSMTTTVTIDPTDNQTASDSLSTNNANVNVIGTENQGETNVPLLSQAVFNRQNSLPSYDDAMRVPSAPPRE